MEYPYRYGSGPLFVGYHFPAGIDCDLFRIHEGILRAVVRSHLLKVPSFSSQLSLPIQNIFLTMTPKGGDTTMRNTPNTVNTASSNTRSRFTPHSLEPERLGSHLSFGAESFEVRRMVGRSPTHTQTRNGMERFPIFKERWISLISFHCLSSLRIHRPLS